MRWILRRKQVCLENTFKAVCANVRITQNVRQRVPDRQISHREGPGGRPNVGYTLSQYAYIQGAP